MASRFETVTPLLSELSIGYFNDAKAFIGTEIAPVVGVKKTSAAYPVYGTDALKLPSRMGVRARGASPEDGTWEYSTDTYTCTERMLDQYVDNRDFDNADSELRVGETNTRTLSERLRLIHEKLAADKLFNATTFSGYTAGLTGSDQWSHADSNPTVQVKIAKDSISLNGVVDPEEITLFVGYEVYSALQVNVKLLTRYQYTDPKVLTPELIAAALGVKKLVVGRAVYESAAGVKTRLWGKYALFGYVPSAPSLWTPSMAYTFALNGGKIKISAFEDEPRNSQVLRGALDLDIKCTAASSGYLFTAAVA